MTQIDRRQWLAGAGATVAATQTAGAAWAAEGREARVYDYLFLDFDGPLSSGPAAEYANRLKGRKAAVEAAGGQLLGLFTPQLGWRAGQAALLVGWAAGAGGRDKLVDELATLPGVRAVRRDRLEATARPGAADRLRPGGIYTHRWFVIDTPSLAEVVSLSTQAWPSFEGQFDSKVFGLFKAAPSAEDQAAGVTRLLLMTRYGSHDVWETSRDPSPEAKAAFARRQNLTRDTWAASVRLTEI